MSVAPVTLRLFSEIIARGPLPGLTVPGILKARTVRVTGQPRLSHFVRVLTRKGMKYSDV